MAATELTGADKLRLYRQMLLIRVFEEQVNFMFLRGALPGTVHQCHGQEAATVGVCSTLNTDDFVVGGHRPHGLALAKGVSPKKAMAELFAKKEGCCRGRGGSMHLGDPDVGMLPSLAIVGASITVAPGMALAFQLQKSRRVAACFFGDGASNEGAFHEGINFAAVRHLPVLFVCENNLYGASTPFETVSRLTNVADRAASYGIPGEALDGMDVLAVREAAHRAVERARSGEGPTLLECKTYRFCGHSRSDPANYRPREELESWKKRDPIIVLENRLLSEGTATREQLDAVGSEVKSEIAAAIEFAEQAPSPAPEEVTEGAFA